MKKRYFLFLLLGLFSLTYVKAYKINSCEVLISYKLNSSQDKDSYICKNADYSVEDHTISFKKKNKTLYLNNAQIYSMQIYSDEVHFAISGKNVISILHLTDKVQIEGKGSLRFKEGSFVKKVYNGKPMYTYIYNESVILKENSEPFVGTIGDFENSYLYLKTVNKLPKNFSIDSFQKIQGLDYSKMTSVSINKDWIDRHIKTSLNTSVVDGYGEVYYEKNKEAYQLESENVVLLTDEMVDSKYSLIVEDLKESNLLNQVREGLNNSNLIQILDISVQKGKKIVPMENGDFTIKIKIQEGIFDFLDYQVVYINDKGEIEEYIDAYLDKDYIVFKTSHLSQYGIIGKEQNAVSANVMKNFAIEKSSVISLLFFFVIVFLFLALIFITAFKFKQFSKKRRC